MFNYKKISQPIFCFFIFGDRIASYKHMMTCLQIRHCPKCFSGVSLAVLTFFSSFPFFSFKSLSHFLSCFLHRALLLGPLIGIFILYLLNANFILVLWITFSFWFPLFMVYLSMNIAQVAFVFPFLYSFTLLSISKFIFCSLAIFSSLSSVFSSCCILHGSVSSNSKKCTSPVKFWENSLQNSKKEAIWGAIQGLINW